MVDKLNNNYFILYKYYLHLKEGYFFHYNIN